MELMTHATHAKLAREFNSNLFFFISPIEPSPLNMCVNKSVSLKNKGKKDRESRQLLPLTGAAGVIVGVPP